MFRFCKFLKWKTFNMKKAHIPVKPIVLTIGHCLLGLMTKVLVKINPIWDWLNICTFYYFCNTHDNSYGL